jgi:hypothetical protein
MLPGAITYESSERPNSISDNRPIEAGLWSPHFLNWRARTPPGSGLTRWRRTTPSRLGRRPQSKWGIGG